jgi:hypothetical protein
LVLLPSPTHTARRALAALAGVVALPLGVPGDVAGLATAASATTDADATAAPPEHEAHEGGDGQLSARCVGATICQIKRHMFSGQRGWTPEYCEKIAAGVLASARKHDLNPALLLAVMINESDLNEKAVGEHKRNGRVYAKDSGLMGIRCLVDDHGTCTNGGVRGRTWKSVMDPLTNIELGARELARWRDGAGVERVTVRKRDSSGHVTEKNKFVTCHHRTHAYWAHYNHGPIYIDKGFARHYPHRVAVLYHALARTLKLRAPELEHGPITINDPGLRPRTVDHPVEPRYRQLCAIIESAHGTCGDVVSSAWPGAEGTRTLARHTIDSSGSGRPN